MFGGQLRDGSLHPLQDSAGQVDEGLVRLGDLVGLGRLFGFVLGCGVLEFLDDAHRFLELFQAAFVLPPAFQAVASAELGAKRQQHPHRIV
jgi:hypothetical protein